MISSCRLSCDAAADALMLVSRHHMSAHMHMHMGCNLHTNPVQDCVCAQRVPVVRIAVALSALRNASDTYLPILLIGLVATFWFAAVPWPLLC
jgi:hypothetical protein